MKYRTTLVTVLFVLGFFLATPGTTLFAQESGIKLIPAEINDFDRPVNPGETVTRELKVTNMGSDTKQFFIYKRDIVGVENGGVPIFGEEGAEKNPYKMSEWVSYPSDSIEVRGGETVPLPITISVPSDATPCSKFAGVFVSQEPPKLREVGAGVGYEVATIISLPVAGTCIDDARIRSFATDKLFYATKNVTFTARIENQGNMLIEPRGPIEIRSALGGDPKVFIVNEDLAGVFPGTTRDLTFSWDEDGIGFGRYEAVLALSYRGVAGQKTIDASVVFWVFPLKVVLPILGGFLFLLLLGYLITRYYINQAIMRAQGTRRVSSYRYRKQVGVSRVTFVFVSIMGALVVFLIVLLIVFA